MAVNLTVGLGPNIKILVFLLMFQQKASIHLQQDRLNMFLNNTRPICLL